MNVPRPSAQKIKIGTCPHGLTQGACPICNGMSGGSKKLEKLPQGEMSWDECFAIGQMLKAQKLAQQQKELATQAQLRAPLNAQIRLESIAQKIAVHAEKLADFVQKAQTQTQLMPKIFLKPLILSAKLAITVLNILKGISIITQKVVNFIREKLADISDKLNAIFGELKNATEKKISDRLKDFKKKFKSILGIFELEDIEDEEKKRLFEFKTVLNSIKEKYLKIRN